MWILYGCNTFSGDYNNYLNTYNYIDILFASKEPLFSSLMYVCSKIGLSFIGFRLVLATIYLALLYAFIRRNTVYTAFVLATLVIFPFVQNISTLRSGIATVIMLFGLQYLQRNRLSGDIKYILCILIAALCHSSSVFFLVFLLAKKKSKFSTLAWIFVGAAALSFVLNQTQLLYNLTSLFIKNQKILNWLIASDTAHPNLNGIIAMLLVIAFMFAVDKLTKKKIEKNRLAARRTGAMIPQSIPAEKKRPRDKKAVKPVPFYDLVDNMYTLSLLFIPFVVYADSFMRLYYAMFPALVCMCTNAFSWRMAAVKHGKVRIAAIGLVTIAVAVLIFLYTDLPYLGTVNEGTLVFTNNSILSFTAAIH